MKFFLWAISIAWCACSNPIETNRGKATAVARTTGRDALLAAIRDPSSGDEWVMLGMRVHEIAREDPRPEIWLDHELWCYNRALRAQPTNTAAVYNRANLVSQGVAWRYRDRVWPSLRDMEPQEKIYGVWLEGMAFAPTPGDQLRRARPRTDPDPPVVCNSGTLPPPSPARLAI